MNTVMNFRFYNTLLLPSQGLCSVELEQVGIINYLDTITAWKIQYVKIKLSLCYK
jgi:hypothetical protein